MKSNRKIFFLQVALGVMAWCYLLTGMYIKYQQEEFEQIRYFLGLSLSQLTNVRV